MAYIQHKQVSTGELITGTFIELGRITFEIPLYLAAFLVIAVAANFVPSGVDWAWLPSMALYFWAQYYLYRMMLVRGGAVIDPRFKVFSLFLMAVLLTIPLYIGFAILVIPGAMLAAKYIMAPAFLVAEEITLMDALGESWRKSDTNFIAIFLAFMVMCIIWLAIMVIWLAIKVLGVTILTNMEVQLAGTGMTTSEAGLELMWPFIHTLPLMLMGLSVTAYRALNHNESDLLAVFE